MKTILLILIAFTAACDSAQTTKPDPPHNVAPPLCSEVNNKRPCTRWTPRLAKEGKVPARVTPEEKKGKR